jgi:hypothetical protein
MRKAIYQALKKCATKKYVKDIYELALVEKDHYLLYFLVFPLMKFGYREEIIELIVNETTANNRNFWFFLDLCAKFKPHPKLYGMIKKIESVSIEEL